MALNVQGASHENLKSGHYDPNIDFGAHVDASLRGNFLSTSMRTRHAGNCSIERLRSTAC